MTPATPAIYTRQNEPAGASVGERIGALIIGLCGLIVLIMAVRLVPNPEGLATHTGLGFKRCSFLETTKLPCPSCGMTTSFAWFVRGNAIASLYVQPMGFVLALLTTAAVWTGFYVALTGHPPHRLMRLTPAKYYLLPLMVFAILAWGWKMFLHIKGIDGWG